VGLPGVGKTTRARSIASNSTALRLTPDEWMAPLFGDSDAGGKRDVLEGRFVWVAHQTLLAGASVILDFGCWSAEERYAIRAVAELAGANFALHYLTLPEPERRRRSDLRWLTSPHETFLMSEADHDRYVRLFAPPSAEELSLASMPQPPAPWPSWPAWAAERWPTLPRLDKP